MNQRGRRIEAAGGLAGVRPTPKKVAQCHDAEDHAGDFERIDERFEPAASADLSFRLTLIFVVGGGEDRGPARQVGRRDIIFDPLVPDSFIEVVWQTLTYFSLTHGPAVGGDHRP